MDATAQLLEWIASQMLTGAAQDDGSVGIHLEAVVHHDHPAAIAADEHRVAAWRDGAGSVRPEGRI